MPNAELKRRLRDAVERVLRDAEVEVGICRDKRIITLTGRVPTRGLQISIEDAVGRLAGDFTVVNQVKVEPPPGQRIVRLH
ncbi:BON domain-containing protein [Ancylobacter sp. IITR112]|uniref:BON domain-containing protein n=1 Tax=Ancylobacter sp. IITR112 TaxID=3138073 RepID=UPI00352BBC3D